MEEPSHAGVLKELHADLRRKYALHAATIETAWRSFDKATRARCLKAGAADGVVLKHAKDRSLGVVCKYVPELNLRDISEPGSDFLLDHLRHRATTTLLDQYMEGAGGGLGDLDFIELMIRTQDLELIEPFHNCISLFLDNETYGDSYKLLRDKEGTMAELRPAFEARQAVPQSTGELVLLRQQLLIQTLNTLIEDILEVGAQNRDTAKRLKKPAKAAAHAMSKLTYREAPASVTFADLLANVQGQKADMEDYLGLLSAEPVVLAHAVNMQFFSQPEIIADEKGCMMPVHTDRHISAALFDVCHNAVRGAAIWTYIGHLLAQLDTAGGDKLLRAIVLQELANACHLEYGRVQAALKREVQTFSGRKWFKRVAKVYDKAGNARVVVKGNMDSLMREDPQLHYLISLCLPSTTASQAVDWLKKLSDLHTAHPEERATMAEAEVDSLGDLAVIVGLFQDLSKTVSMPQHSSKKGQTFVARLQGLQAELNLLKSQVDLSDFAVPIDNLLVPGKAGGALTLLDQFVTEKAGTQMGLLYQDLVEDCQSEIQQQHRLAQAKLAPGSGAGPPPIPASDAEPQGLRVERRRQKEKTRPPHSSWLELAPCKGVVPAAVAVPSRQTFRVSASTAAVFATLLAKSFSRGSVTWSAFEAAMADVGFSIMPKIGSVYTFLPPDTMDVQRPITVHRPHQSKIEGCVILIFARRLRRVYGWNEDTFVVV